MNVTISGQERRLPIYLLLDCSGSMRGAPIDAVNVGIRQFLSDVNDNQAEDSVHIGVITFSETAELITKGLVPVDSFTPPTLKASGRETCLGKALRVLQESLDRDIVPRVPGGSLGDYKPLVFILTDGEPTDADVWPVEREKMKQRLRKQLLSIVTVGCGPNINEDNLRTIAMGDAYHFRTDDMSKSFGMFFKWVSQSAIRYTVTVTQSNGAQTPPIDRPHTQVFQFVR